MGLDRLLAPLVMSRNRMKRRAWLLAGAREGEGEAPLAEHTQVEIAIKQAWHDGPGLLGPLGRRVDGVSGKVHVLDLSSLDVERR